MRLLTFPRDQIVGTLEWRTSWDPESGPVLATGDVPVPEDEEIGFSAGIVESLERRADGSWGWTGGQTPLDLGFLRELPVDAFFAVNLRRPLVESSVENLTHIAPGLRRLTLAHADLHDESLTHIAQIRELTSLQTFGNHFTDAGVQCLEALTSLENLWLEEESLTGAAFDFAIRLTRLKRLGLQDVRSTEEQLRRLRESLPGVNVG